MSATLFLDTIEIEVDALEAIAFEINGDNNKTSAFPYPLLKKSGKDSQISLRIAVLQNEEIEATLALDLGGRIIKLLDRRTGLFTFNLPPNIRLTDGGPRGVFWNHGIEFACGPNHLRLNGLGPVEFHCIEQENPDEDRAEIILHEMMAGTEISWHTRISLAKNSCWLNIDTRIINRSSETDLETNTGIRIFNNDLLPGTVSNLDNSTFWHQKSPDDQAGIIVRFPQNEFDTISNSELGSALSQNLTGQNPLFARNTQSVSYAICPSPNFSSNPIFFANGVIGIKDNDLIGRSFESEGKVKLSLGWENSFMAANWDTQSNRLLSVSGLNNLLPEDSNLPKNIKVSGQDFVEMSAEFTLPEQLSDALKITHLTTEDFANSPLARTRMGSKRNSGHWLLACEALKSGDIAGANRSLDDALNYAGDDHFVWWLKAALLRLQLDVDQEMPERPELLNAHFLAPLEPLLRVEAFLSINNNFDKEPSSVLKPIGNHIDALCDIACLLLETGLLVDAARFLDEALRHSDHSNLRYLMANLLLQRPNMKMEAAQHISVCEIKPIEAPLPWRRLEIKAILELAEQFPSSAKLQKLAKLYK